MHSAALDRSMSCLSLNSVESQAEDDWDRSLIQDGGSTSVAIPIEVPVTNSGTPPTVEVGDKKRTLSDLFKLHSEKGSNGNFSVGEAKRIADLLGQWINASSSPYEGDDDFFMRHAQDDIALNASGSFRRVFVGHAGRPRGKSETVPASTNAGSRPPSVLGTRT